MACSLNEEMVLELHKHYSQISLSSDISSAQDQPRKIKLNRGGWIVETQEGNIQFSMVPETVKDTMLLGKKVPLHFIVPKDKFDKKFCINVCEFEFPAYFSFFMQKQRVNLLCSQEEEQQIRAIFQETLLGPVSFDDFEDDFDSNIDKDLIPRIRDELNVFKGGLSIDMLLKFTHFDQNGVAKIGETVEVHRTPTQIQIYENGKVIAQGKNKAKIGFTEFKSKDLKKHGVFYNPQSYQDDNNSYEFNEQDQLQIYKEIPIISDFKPPQFGLTVLGSSHGFDGYIIWVGGRGIMIDPPPFSTVKLRQLGIPSYYIKWIILSHCHADHDAGVFMKIFESSQVEIITTKTIMNSFMRKYSNITGIAIDQLRKFFAFRPAKIGANCKINGANFEFYYSLHAIPCVGFICRYEGKSIYFSADTYYDPLNMKKNYVDKGFMTEKRYNYLTDFQLKFQHDIILHEMGVPPIHTPTQILADLPQEIKDKMLLVHVNPDQIPKEGGLKAAKEGIEHTIILIPNEQQSVQQSIYYNIDLLTSLPFLHGAHISCVRDLVENATEQKFQKDEIIIKEGDMGNQMFIIKNGYIKIFSQFEGKQFERYCSVGNFFGEAALFKGSKRHATVQAVTDCVLLVLNGSDFNFIFENTDIPNSLQNLMNSRKQLSLGGLSKNSLLNHLISSQKMFLEQILEKCDYQQGSIIQTIEAEIQFVFLLNSGRLQKIQPGSEIINLEEGSLIAETHNIINKKPHQIALVVLTDVQGFKISKNNWLIFLQQNPGLYLQAFDNNVFM